jgi:hypothetical protein
MAINSLNTLNQTLIGYLKEDYVDYLELENIPCFKQSFCQFLQELRHDFDDNLDESFRRWCNQLSKGRAFPEVRRVAVYVLWFYCKLKQYHIAKLLNMSTRQIRRDMREIEKQMRTWH